MTDRAPAGPLRTDDLAPRLGAWARRRLDRASRLTAVHPMPGNAGLSFGFTVETRGTETSFVIRLEQPGVRRSGNADVLRQVPLLQARAEAGTPVAPVVWSAGDPVWFGTDSIIQEWVPVRPLHMYDAALSVATGEPFDL